MAKQYGWPVSKEMAELCTAKVHGIVTGEDATYLCSAALDGTLYVVNGRTGQGYAIDHKDLIELAKANNWSEQTKPEYGRFLDKNVLIIRKDIGSCAEDGVDKYLMQITDIGCPVIENTITQKRFILDWEQIIDLAKAAGIDEAEEGEV